MSDTENGNRHARALADYMESRLLPGQSMRSFCIDIGFDYARVSAWKMSARSHPDLGSLIRLAEALNMSLGQILVVAEYGTPEELAGAVPPKLPDPPNAQRAIEQDPTLSDVERGMLQSMWSTIEDMRAGAATVRRKATKR